MCIYGNSLSDSITWYDIDVRVLSGKRKFTPKLAIFIMGNDGFKQGVLGILSRVQLWGLPPKRLRFSLRFLRLSVSLPLRHGIHQVTWWSLKISKQLRETMVITCYHPTWGMNELEHVTYVYIQTLLYIYNIIYIYILICNNMHTYVIIYICYMDVTNYIKLW